jgi:APA family basic amino acid/polyamine antiporter
MSSTKINYAAAFSLVVANMIGVGIFTSLGFQLFGLSDYRVILLLWIVGGLLAVMGSFCYAELSAAFPRSGGEYNFLSEAFGRFVGFLSGWVSITLGFSAPIAAAAHAFSKYFSHLLPSGISPDLLSVSLIILITVVHLFKKNIGANFQIFITAGKLILMALFIIAGFYFSTSNTQVNYLVTNADMSTELFSAAFWVSLIYVSYAYSGWNATAYMIDEIDRPEKNVPRSILTGTLVVMILYVLMNFVFLLSAPADAMRGKEDVGFVVADYIFSNKGALIIGGLISFFLVSTISSMVVVGPRVISRVAQDFPELNYLSVFSKNDVPVRAIIIQSLIAIVILLTTDFQFVITCIGFVLTLFTTLSAAGLMWLRRKRANVVRPIRVPFYPILPIVYIMFNSWIMFYLLVNKPYESGLGLLFVAVGAVFYFVVSKRKISGTAMLLVLLITLSSCSQNQSKTNLTSEDSVVVKNNDTTVLSKNDSVNQENSLKDDDNSKYFDFKSNENLNECASYLACLDSNNIPSDFKKYASKLNNAWNKKKQKMLNPVSEWMKQEHLDTLGGKDRLVFYPFSGPDFDFANAFYSDASTYVMIGLEGIGDLSLFEKDNTHKQNNFIKEAGNILRTTNRLGFFVTNHMRSELRVNGTMSIIAFYVKKMGGEIGEITPMHWDKDKGIPVELTRGLKGDMFKLVCKMDAQSKPITIYYFSKDISDHGLEGEEDWLAWVKKTADNRPIVSLTKSASYLMHLSSFSLIRDFILENSVLHIQDDSGIPLADMETEDVTVKLYGKYTRTIKLFSGRVQRDMRSRYADRDKVESLPFAIGYNVTHRECNLQVRSPYFR